jgi:hypothetical protein
MPLDIDLPEWTRKLLEILRERMLSVLVAVFTATAVGVWTYWRAKIAFALRQFLHRVNFSLNYVDGKFLRFRTLQESDLRDVLLNNRHAVGLVTAAASHATLEQPILQFSKSDAWVVLNSVLNELSEQFAAGFLAKSMGLPTRSEWYVFALTCEKDPDVRINKVRVLVAAESLLDKIEELTDLQFEVEHHRIRRNTLVSMAHLRADPKRSHNLLRVELTLPTMGADR